MPGFRHPDHIIHSQSVTELSVDGDSDILVSGTDPDFQVPSAGKTIGLAVSV